MTTQLAFSIEPKQPLVSEPSIRLYICPVRDKCHDYGDGYKCGFEQAGSVMACHKRKRMEASS